jgi:hypothetical protein
MKRNIVALCVSMAILILIASGAAHAGGGRQHSYSRGGHGYKGYHYHGGGYHPRPHRYHHWPAYRHHYYRPCGPPVRYYSHYRGYYPGWGGTDGGYYFSGTYSEPGFGFAFGTRGSW